MCHNSGGMEKFFATFGKVALIILIMGALAGAGYYLGRSGNLPFLSQTPAPGAVTTTAPQELPPQTQPALPAQTPTPTPVPIKTVSAGLGNISGVNFPKYTIEIPSDWTVKQEHSEVESPMDVLTVTKGSYQLKIFQAATGGAICLYPGDADTEGPNSRFDNFVTITNAAGNQFRRSGTTATSGTKRGFTVCQKSEAYGNFQQPTNFGHTSYTTPLTPDDAILKEMDTMIASLKKI